MAKRCVFTSPVSLLLLEKGGGIERTGKEGEMNGKTVGGKAAKAYARDNLPIYPSLKAIRS